MTRPASTGNGRPLGVGWCGRAAQEQSRVRPGPCPPSPTPSRPCEPLRYRRPLWSPRWPCDVRTGRCRDRRSQTAAAASGRRAGSRCTCRGRARVRGGDLGRWRGRRRHHGDPVRRPTRNDLCQRSGRFGAGGVDADAGRGSMHGCIRRAASTRGSWPTPWCWRTRCVRCCSTRRSATRSPPPLVPLTRPPVVAAREQEYGTDTAPDPGGEPPASRCPSGAWKSDDAELGGRDRPAPPRIRTR
jgi:hypothetical protein